MTTLEVPLVRLCQCLLFLSCVLHFKLWHKWNWKWQQKMCNYATTNVCVRHGVCVRVCVCVVSTMADTLGGISQWQQQVINSTNDTRQVVNDSNNNDSNNNNKNRNNNQDYKLSMEFTLTSHHCMLQLAVERVTVRKIRCPRPFLALQNSIEILEYYVILCNIQRGITFFKTFN